MSVLARIATSWGLRSFGEEHMTNLPLRALRHGEESIEVMQSLKVSEEVVHQMVRNVYSKPPGDPLQEIGGSLMTANMLCEVMGVEADIVLELEIQRVLSKPPAHFAERNKAKLNLGLDVPKDKT